MKFNFFKIIVISFFILNSAKAMHEEQIIDSSHFSLTKQIIQEKENFLLASNEYITLNDLPEEVLVKIFSFLDVTDLEKVILVSTQWKELKIKYYGDYLILKALKDESQQKAVSHYLNVIVKTPDNLKEIEKIISNYRLDLVCCIF